MGKVKLQPDIIVSKDELTIINELQDKIRELTADRANLIEKYSDMVEKYVDLVDEHLEKNSKIRELVQLLGRDTTEELH